MADIFLSYARTERERALPIKVALASLGLNVFFDVDGLDGGDVFPDVLDREVKSAGAVVSLWSPHALTRPWIKIESRIGKDRGVLIPVEIGVLDPLHDVPAAFYDDQRIDFVDFNGDTSSPGWLKLVKSLARTLERPDLLEQEVRSHAHSSAEAADLRAELAALRTQMGELAAAKSAASSQERGRKEAFALIDDSRRVEDYRRFLQRYPEGAEAFEAERRIDILQSWSRVAHDDPDAIETWFRESRISVFPALRDEALRMQATAKKNRQGPSRIPLVLAGVVVLIGVGLGGFALSQSQFWDRGEATSPEAASSVGTGPATDTTLGSGDLYDVVNSGDALPLDVVSGESTGAVSTPEPQYRPGDTIRDTLSGGGRGPKMVVVPSGTFTMGSPASEAGRLDDEGPQRTVRIGYEFAVGKTEVTWAEWEACVGDGGCESNLDKTPNWGAKGDAGWGRGNRPVINVSWNDAQAYAEWLSRKTGERYRLLSEAEWEYVARAGTSTRFSWGDGDPTCSRGASNGANFISCTSDRTEPVGFSAANAFGVHDMHGNVWEWTEDCYQDSYSGAPTDGSARIVSNCSLRVLRGGSRGNTHQALRSAYRDWNHPSSRGSSRGFRVARTLSPPTP